jgi:hypothetical protein
MPGITIHLGEKHLATISLARLNIVDVSAYGALDQDPGALLHASGGNYDGSEASGHRIWLDQLPLQPKQTLKVCFVETCESGDKGNTIAELYPDEEPCDQADFLITPEMEQELRARPRLYDAFAVRTDTSRGQQAIASSEKSNTSFTFRVLWNWTQPDQVRVDLTTHCLENVIERTSGRRHLTDVLTYGESACFTVLSEPEQA